MKIIKRLVSFILISQIFYCRDRSVHSGYYKEWDLSTSWIVSPKQAREMEKIGAIKIYSGDFKRSFLLPEGTISLNWKEFSIEEKNKNGKLKSKKEILDILKDYQIEFSKPILVFGNTMNGWGEEGRIVWMLRTIGITNSYLVDGGIDAIMTFEKKNLKNILKSYPKSDEQNIFVGQKNLEDYNIESENLIKLINDKDTAIIDTREKIEFEGSTPYGETRGGHIPTAQWFYFRELLDKEGFILDEGELMDKIKLLNISKEKTIISYCTGGVRSAWVTAVFQSYGYNAKNYSGSMWGWSCLDEKDGYVLQK